MDKDVWRSFPLPEMENMDLVLKIREHVSSHSGKREAKRD